MAVRILALRQLFHYYQSRPTSAEGKTCRFLVVYIQPDRGLADVEPLWGVIEENSALQAAKQRKDADTGPWEVMSEVFDLGESFESEYDRLLAKEERNGVEDSISART